MDIEIKVILFHVLRDRSYLAPSAINNFIVYTQIEQYYNYLNLDIYETGDMRNAKYGKKDLK